MDLDDLLPDTTAFYDYQRKARETAIYPNIGKNLWYPTLGLNGEAGEVAEKVKKIYRDHRGKVTPTLRLAIVRELGDVLWYIANICSELDVSLAGVAWENLRKLTQRKKDNKISGEGDER